MRHLKLIAPAAQQSQISQDLTDNPESPSVRIAFASSDRVHINQHFGAARAFMIYDVSSQTYQVSEIVEFSTADAQQDKQHSQLDARLDLLQGCHGVYCNAIGGGAIRQLQAMGIYPVKVDEGLLIEVALKNLQSLWQSRPPLWLQKALRQLQQPDAGQRFLDMAKSSWDGDWSDDLPREEQEGETL
ncbi:NifB/NifX family molybdenum-iron cluster-binding protein [Oceanospirillum sediminis]|uniref:Nitrogen fixation protein NifX n=1 Tax=Oceanospirillum sediminis TaxID=2760088 RepID=A0A839IP62_9GAMM|nr:NifB/NifX family molybdenum-iron cluster-binding protein [Oceanospirillum sediminis]MBB1486470.1 nitrogen fixation protein NifX [Oceanospirillum sediminis]